MLESTRMLESYSSEEFFSIENLDRADAAVTEIFSMMFGFDIHAVEGTSPDPPSCAPYEMTAIVGFSGSMRGSCQIGISAEAARSVASAMLGGMPVDNDDCVNDALGELCNMLAGGWKNSVPGLSSECALSPPTVISGRDYKVHTAKPSAKLSRTYQFDTHKLHLTLCREEALPPEA